MYKVRQQDLPFRGSSHHFVGERQGDVGVSVWTLRDWVNATRPTSPAPLTTDERTELAQLRREVRQLREERDILKKATAFFAKQSE